MLLMCLHPWSGMWMPFNQPSSTLQPWLHAIPSECTKYCDYASWAKRHGACTLSLSMHVDWSSSCASAASAGTAHSALQTICVYLKAPVHLPLLVMHIYMSYRLHNALLETLHFLCAHV